MRPTSPQLISLAATGAHLIVPANSYTSPQLISVASSLNHGATLTVKNAGHYTTPQMISIAAAKVGFVKFDFE